eukprot:TRINITY_DN19967_c0_g1_i2.p1 TRINITY_DN19967_c0_g1~~TRINITY_DN19967_c0_g1_i2.p1  ORF type:complete len:234 (-),score=47.12 TRINITY_DN19967_c0_g1_i2:206-907(-)
MMTVVDVPQYTHSFAGHCTVPLAMPTSPVGPPGLNFPPGLEPENLSSPTHQDATRSHLLIHPVSPTSPVFPAAGPLVVGHLQSPFAPPPPPPPEPPSLPIEAWFLESKLAAQSARERQEKWAEEMRRNFVVQTSAGQQTTLSPEADAVSPESPKMSADPHHADSPATPKPRDKLEGSRILKEPKEQLSAFEKLLLLTGQAPGTPGETPEKASKLVEAVCAPTPQKETRTGQLA